MAPQLTPQDPRFTTESERIVWEQLRDSLGPLDTLIANLRMTDTHKDHEADLVVVMPDVGVVVVEGKGSSPPPVWSTNPTNVSTRSSVPGG